MAYKNHNPLLTEEEKDTILSFWRERGRMYGFAGTSRKFNIPVHQIKYLVKNYEKSEAN